MLSFFDGGRMLLSLLSYSITKGRVDNTLHSERVNIVVDDKGLLKEMNKQTNKHELNCNQRNKCNGSNQKIDTYIVTVADMVDIALASCPTWLCCLLLANSS
uniref:Uncharacterized protein n=1 Tax=Pseudo-nitzschia australis TaxID=44445 RepID=A0A7S4AR55_9STRA